MKQTFITKQYDAQPIEALGGQTPEELLPCPFCGAHGAVELTKSVSCQNCGAKGPAQNYHSAKLAKWNARSPEHAVLEEENGKLREALEMLREAHGFMWRDAVQNHINQLLK